MGHSQVENIVIREPEITDSISQELDVRPGGKWGREGSSDALVTAGDGDILSL
jgi:hypothetical protein